MLWNRTVSKADKPAAEALASRVRSQPQLGHGVTQLTGGGQVPPSGIGQPELFTFYSGPKDVFEAHFAAHEETLRALTGTDHSGEDPGLAALQSCLHHRRERRARRLCPGLLRVPRDIDPDHVLLDRTLAECDRVGGGRADCSPERRRQGVNVQLVTDPAGCAL